MRKTILIFILSISLIYIPKTLADINTGVVAFFPFNGNANDKIGNGYDGTVVGATLCENRLGNFESAYCFDGSNDYIEIGDQPNFPIWPSYAVSLWFLHDGGGDMGASYGHKIIDKTVWHHDFYLSVYAQTHCQLVYRTYESGHGTIVDNSYDYRDKKWHNIVINKTGTDGEMWVDGILKGTSSVIKTVDSNGVY